jgi:hypothetical protein
MPTINTTKHERMTAERMARLGGEHLAIVHTFIQQRFMNGENVHWGSHEPLQPGGRSLTVADFEQLACRIAVAAINEHTARVERTNAVIERGQSITAGYYRMGGDND